MPGKLLNRRMTEPVSPFIDVVVNAFAAVFIVLVIYVILVQPRNEPPPPECLQGFRPPPMIQGQTYLFTVPVVGGKSKVDFYLPQEQLQRITTLGLDFDSETGTIYGDVTILPEKPNSSPHQHYCE